MTNKMLKKRGAYLTKALEYNILCKLSVIFEQSGGVIIIKNRRLIRYGKQAVAALTAMVILFGAVPAFAGQNVDELREIIDAYGNEYKYDHYKKD
jgi:hypothetical protein